MSKSAATIVRMDVDSDFLLNLFAETKKWKKTKH